MALKIDAMQPIGTSLRLYNIFMNVLQAIQIYIHGPFTGDKVEKLAIQAYDHILSPGYVTTN